MNNNDRMNERLTKLENIVYSIVPKTIEIEMKFCYGCCEKRPLTKKWVKCSKCIKEYCNGSEHEYDDYIYQQKNGKYQCAGCLGYTY